VLPDVSNGPDMREPGIPKLDLSRHRGNGALCVSWPWLVRRPGLPSTDGQAVRGPAFRQFQGQRNLDGHWDNGSFKDFRGRGPLIGFIRFSEPQPRRRRGVIAL